MLLITACASIFMGHIEKSRVRTDRVPSYARLPRSAPRGNPPPDRLPNRVLDRVSSSVQDVGSKTQLWSTEEAVLLKQSVELHGKTNNRAQTMQLVAAGICLAAQQSIRKAVPHTVGCV